MQEEFDALQTQGTWVLVPPSSDKNVIGSKWVYKIKRNSDGSVLRYKARLAAQATTHKWDLRQLDVKNAFLHGELQEEVVILLLYVDDIIITGSNTQLIQYVIHTLSEVFNLKDMGKLAYFLGLQVTYNFNADLFINQVKYVKDLLHKAGMDDCKSCSTPCKPHNQILTSEGMLLPDPTLYKSLVGAFQYLTFTRPDIAFVVNTMCQYMHAPIDLHLGMVKRILHFLKRTMHCGLTYISGGSLQLNAYSDSD
ncbi:uncharacterized mitochondrial protein AtMg00810-like [Malus domestica]|uniref:uncharacterized mitochondrial protein AtMg00810-like n=1 Tax=Malus domestica TaxID=3750 RepID=UPI00397564C9